MPARSMLSYAPAVLALAVAQVSYAASTSVVDLTNKVTLSAPLGTESGSGDGVVYNNLLGFAYSANGAFFMNIDNGSSATPGYQGLYFSGAGATPVLVTSATDTLHSYVLNSGPAVPFVQTTSPVVMNANGTFAGKEVRGYGVATSNPTFLPFGSDSFVVVNGNVITVGVGGTQTAFAIDTNGYNGTTTAVSITGGNSTYSNVTLGNIYHSYPVSSGTVNGQYGLVSVVAVSNSNLVIGNATRTDGVDNPANGVVFGTDAYVYDPSQHVDGQADNGVTILPGITSDSYVSTTHQSNTGTTLYYVTATNAAIAINNAGSVVGTSTRYTPYASGGAEISAGQDAWLYTPATSSNAATTAQIGIGVAGVSGSAIASPVAGYLSVPVTINSGTASAKTYNYQSSNVFAINANGAVAGTSVVYTVASVTSTTGTATAPTSAGQEAWIYTPVAAGGTNAVGTGYSAPGAAATAGTYAQVGLTSTGTPTTAGYVGNVGVTNIHSSSISALSSAGYATGTSNRYFSNSATSLGTDAWFYSPLSGNVPITPAANSSFSNYVSSASVSSSSGLFLNNSTTDALVAGIQTRYAPGTATSAGSDGFVYVADENKTYVIASPATLAGLSTFSAYSGDFNANEFFSTTIRGVTDTGIVYGYFTADTGASGSAAIGTYIFEWTEQSGTELLTASATTAGVDPLTSSQWSLLQMTLYADANGNIFDWARETNNGQVYGAVEISVPEPASLGLMGLGGLTLLRRRSKR